VEAGDILMQLPWDTYREKALELCARANKQTDFALQAEYEALAFLYMDFAEELEAQQRDHKAPRETNPPQPYM
jgi:hypothetical protein